MLARPAPITTANAMVRIFLCMFPPCSVEPVFYSKGEQPTKRHKKLFCASLWLKSRFRIFQDFEDRFTVCFRKVRKVGARVFTGQDLAEPAINVVFQGIRHSIEGLGVDEITERGAKQPVLEIQLPKRAAAFITRSLAHEIRCKTRRGRPRIR